MRSAARAFDTVYLDDTLVGPAADTSNTTRPFSRFCSGSLAGPAEGFDRHIYFANEEEGTPANSFDGKGGLSVAVFDGKAHGLSALGRFSWENTLVQPNHGNRTVIMGMEDGPADQDRAKENSQLWMYVGTKSRRKGATVLERNGLVGGTLYVFRAKDPAVTGEAGFTAGDLTGEWVAIPGAGAMTAVELEAAADAVGAMAFARPEDGAFDLNDRNRFFWVTTGGAAGANVLGRVYSLRLHPGDPLKAPKLSLVVNADEVVAAGGDTALSPDNIGVSGRYLMVQEDGTTESRAEMARKGRDGSIWRYRLTSRGTGIEGGHALPARTRRRRGRPRRVGDQRHHQHRRDARERQLALRRPGPPAHGRARCQHRGGRTAGPAAAQVAAVRRWPRPSGAISEVRRTATAALSVANAPARPAARRRAGRAVRTPRAARRVPRPRCACGGAGPRRSGRRSLRRRG